MTRQSPLTFTAYNVICARFDTPNVASCKSCKLDGVYAQICRAVSEIPNGSPVDLKDATPVALENGPRRGRQVWATGRGRSIQATLRRAILDAAVVA